MASKLHIIVGHYGSGKTEFAVNYAFDLRKDGSRVALADLDIVNPYFRSREHADELEAEGIHVVSNNFQNDWKMDLPALNSELYSFFENEDRENILDVGGNAAGARVLARFCDRLRGKQYDMWLVFNANRYETQNAEAAIEFARSIERMSGLTITGLINNTHMLMETEEEDLVRGDRIAREVSQRMGIPYVFMTCREDMLDGCREHEWGAPLYPIRIYMRPKYLL